MAMPQAPGEVEVHTVGVKHDYADGPAGHGEAPSRAQPPPPGAPRAGAASSSEEPQ